MTGHKLFPILLFLILFGSLQLAPVLLLAQQDEVIDWRYEIDLLGSELAEKHPNLFFKYDSIRFYHEFDLIAREAPGQSLFEVSVRLQQVVAKLGDAHTAINYHFNIGKEFILPLECYWFEDGIYVLKAPIEFQQILGKKIISINETPIEQVIDSLSTLIVNENPSMVKNHIPRMITWTQLLKYFEFGEQQGVSIMVEDQQGIETKQFISLPVPDGDFVSVQPDSIPLGWQDRKAYFRHLYFPAENLFYIQYNRCWSREVEEEYGSGASALFMPSFKEFEKEVLQVLKKQQIDKVVFDMRFNGGGNSNQGTRFIRKLCKLKLKGEGKFYVVVGRKTFSSAIINTVDFMKNTEVIIVGEQTGGRPNHFGEVKRFVLPESKLVVNYSTKYFTLLEEDVPTITPDIMVPISYNIYMKGIDPAIEEIRKHPSE